MRNAGAWAVLFVLITAAPGCFKGYSSVETPDSSGGDSAADATSDGASSDQGGNNGGNNGTDASADVLVPDQDAPDQAPPDMRPPPDMAGDTSPVDMGPVDMSPMDMGPTDMNMTPDTGMDMGMDLPNLDDLVLPPGTCGNMIVEFGEYCDPCNLNCDDNNACTVDEIGGDSATCLAFCWNRPINGCVDADGCCPAGCDSSVDSDCSTTCGDMVIDAGETCDGDCPDTCDDMDPSTRDIMTGDAATCNVQCSNVPIRRCIDGDGYCPDGCTEAYDNDCSANCGNGIIESGETCDPPSSCPQTCSDQNPCTQDQMTGSPVTCNVQCSRSEIIACIDNDGCCADRCRSNQDNDCSPTCGNGVIEADETCDPRSDCQAIVCNQGGACSTSFMTGHQNSCNVRCTYPDIFACAHNDGCCPSGCDNNNDNDCDAACGNGILESGEVCDPPESCELTCLDDGDVCTTTEYAGDPAMCTGRCTHVPITTCGLDDGCCPPGCSSNDDPNCVPTCGNGFVEAGEICDGNCPSCDDGVACTADTMLGSPATCDVICQHADILTCTDADGCCGPGCNALNDSDCPPVCGNGLVEAPETCDGNCPSSCADTDVCTADVRNGSDATCDVTCSNTTITACTGTDGCCPSGCNANNDGDCTPVCGNGVTESGETCDGNCPSTCNDNIACTADSRSGSSGSCNVVCTNTTITACTGGDGCCPSACTNANDSDCPL